VFTPYFIGRADIERQPPEKPWIRWMIARDLDEVASIEALSFSPAPAGGAPGASPLDADLLRAALSPRNRIGLVAERGETIVGWMLYELHPRHGRLVRLAFHPGHRREGVGTWLVLKLRTKLSDHRRDRLITTVPDTMLEAHLFLRSTGFRAERVLPGRFGEQDGYLFAIDLADACRGR